MLSLQTQSKYIKRTIQLPNGSWALVVFELVEVNGKIIAKAISGKILGQTETKNEEVLALPLVIEKESIEVVVSPFFPEVDILIKDLSFVLSQPARGPNSY